MTILATTELDLVAARQLLEQTSQRRLSFYAGLAGIVIVALLSLGTDLRPAPESAGAGAEVTSELP